MGFLPVVLNILGMSLGAAAPPWWRCQEEEHGMANSAPREGAEAFALSVKEACEICCFGRTTFYKLLKRGQIPVRKVGSRTLILPEELHQALKSLPRAGMDL